MLGWEVVREIENRVGTVALRGVLRKAMVAGVLERRPLRPLSLLLLGALREGCLYIADAEEPSAARDEVIEIVHRHADHLPHVTRGPPSGECRR